MYRWPYRTLYRNLSVSVTSGGCASERTLLSGARLTLRNRTRLGCLETSRHFRRDRLLAGHLKLPHFREPFAGQRIDLSWRQDAEALGTCTLTQTFANQSDSMVEIQFGELRERMQSECSEIFCSKRKLPLLAVRLKALISFHCSSNRFSFGSRTS